MSVAVTKDVKSVPTFGRAAGTDRDLDLAFEVLTGFEAVLSMSESIKPMQWVGPLSREARIGIASFIDTDPIYHSLRSTLADVSRDSIIAFDQRFEEAAKELLGKVYRTVQKQQTVDTSDLENMYRAYIGILYTNIIDEVEDPVRSSLIDTSEMTCCSFIYHTELERAKQQRKERAEDLVLKYMEQVSEPDSVEEKLSLMELCELWEFLQAGPNRPDLTALLDDTKEQLRVDLQIIHGLVGEIGSIDQKPGVRLRDDIKTGDKINILRELPGLGHLSHEEVVCQLVEANIGKNMALNYCSAASRLARTGVRIPKDFVKDIRGRIVVTNAAKGAYGAMIDPNQSATAMTQLLGLEARMCTDVDIASQIKTALGEDASRLDILEIYEYVDIVQSKGLQVSEEIILNLTKLKKMGYLRSSLKDMFRVVEDLTDLSKAQGFLQDVVVLTEHKIHGLDKLIDEMKSDDIVRRSGAICEAYVASKLIKNGHKVIGVRVIGPTSGHDDYDIVAEIDGVRYGIEVKNTMETLQQTNYLGTSQEMVRNRITDTQIYYFSRHASRDRYIPAIICRYMGGKDLVSADLNRLWKLLGQHVEQVPVFLDPSGERIRGLGFGNSAS